MAALTPTLVKRTEFAGDYKLLVLTVTAESASDTITLTAATHGITEIKGVMATITGGQDAAFTSVSVSYSGLAITLVSVEQDGTPSTAWGDTTVELWVLGGK